MEGRLGFYSLIKGVWFLSIWENKQRQVYEFNSQIDKGLQTDISKIGRSDQGKFHISRPMKTFLKSHLKWRRCVKRACFWLFSFSFTLRALKYSRFQDQQVAWTFLIFLRPCVVILATGVPHFMAWIRSQVALVYAAHQTLRSHLLTTDGCVWETQELEIISKQVRENWQSHTLSNRESNAIHV